MRATEAQDRRKYNTPRLGVRMEEAATHRVAALQPLMQQQVIGLSRLAQPFPEVRQVNLGGACDRGQTVHVRSDDSRD